LTEVGNPGNTATATATCTTNMPTDLIVFHNRESGRVAYLDDLVVESLTLLGGPTLTWDGVADGNWSDASWVGANPPPPPTYPDATVNAEIGPMGTNNTVTVDGNHAAATLAISGNGALIVGAGNSLDVGSDISAAGQPVTLQDNATLRVGGGGAIGSVATQGNATIENASDVASSHLAMQSGNTLTKGGAGVLEFDQSAGSNVIDGTNSVRVDAGELKMQAASNPLGGADLVLGGATFTVRGADAYDPGLVAGSLTGNPSGGANPGNFGTALSLDGMYTDGGPNDALREAHWRGPRGDSGNGPDNTTLIYTGQINLDPATGGVGNSAGVTTFVEQNDDKTRLYLDGSLILSHDSWNDAVSVQYTPAGGPGWYDFEVRFSNGGGGYGFFRQQNTGAGDSNWNRDPNTDPLAIAGGFGVAAGLVSGQNADNYTFPVDPGDASVFRHFVGIDAIGMTDTDVAVTADSTLNAISDGDAAFGALTLSNNATLSLTGTATEFSFAGLSGDGTAAGADVSVRELLSPGSSAGAVIVGEDLTLVGNIEYLWDLVDPTTYDLVSVLGDFNIDPSVTNPTLMISADIADFFDPAGHEFVLIEYGGNDPGNMPAWTIDLTNARHYQGGQVVYDTEGNRLLLTSLVVPEPGTLVIWSLLAALGIGCGWYRRRK
jgi:hypothetical protein